jgi:DNA polymerase III sliding clamp (beta) subunit (PCNA family)
MTNIIFEAKKLAAVALAQSTEQTRYYLNGVMFEGSRAVATNGHIITIANDENTDNGTEQRIMPISKKAIAAMKKKLAHHVAFEDGMLKVMDEYDGIIHIEPSVEIDGTFPDYVRILPKYTKDECFEAFDGKYLALLNDVSKILDMGSAVRISGKRHDVQLVRYAGSPDIFSALMPIREGDEPLNVLPSWLKIPKEYFEEAA